MVDYLRRATANLRRAESGLAAQAKARAAAQRAQDAKDCPPTPPTRPRGRPPRPEGPQTPARAIDEQASRERAASYMPLAPSFKHLIDLAESGTGVGHAVRMVERITKLMDRGGWTTSERTMLCGARQKWRARADGKDARYRVVGTKRGRLSRDQQAQVDACQQPDGIEAVIAETLETVRGQR